MSSSSLERQIKVKQRSEKKSKAHKINLQLFQLSKYIFLAFWCRRKLDEAKPLGSASTLITVLSLKKNY